MKRIISLTLALLTLVSFIPASVFAVTWDGNTFHTDQDEAPKISYHKAYSYLKNYPDTITGQYAIRGVNSPRPAMLNADNYPDGNDTIDYWQATAESPYFAVSFKMTVPDTFTSKELPSWKSDNTGGEELGGSDQSWMYDGSMLYAKNNPRMGISLGYEYGSDEYKALGYTYGFFGFAYQDNEATTVDGAKATKYKTPKLMFGPTRYEQDTTNATWPDNSEHQSPFYQNRKVHDLNSVPVLDKDGKTVVYKDFTKMENVIMLVGSYINGHVTLKAYINGYQIAEIWGGKSTFEFDDETKTAWCGSTDPVQNITHKFGGQVGFVNQLNGNLAYARFTRASHALDQNAFNVHHAKVDASRPNDANTNYYYDQANQWKVDKQHFAASYTINIPAGELDYNAYNGSNSYNGAESSKYTSLNCGLVLGRESQIPGLLKGTIDFRFTDLGNGKCQWDDNSRLIFGPDNFYDRSDGNSSGANPVSSKLNWKNGNTGIPLSTGTHTILLTGDYNATDKTATLTVWLDGVKIKSWFNEEVNTIYSFGEDVTNLGDRNYVGWRTNVKGVNAVARFTQWDTDANMDYAAANGTVFDLKTAGPMTGYWDRVVEQNALTWGADESDTYDSVTYTPYNEAWEGYEHPNNNAYQLGMITDPTRSFVVQADIPYTSFKGFYITPEKPTDETNDGLNIGFSDGGMDDVRKWYNKYYYIQLREDGAITPWINMGDGDPADTKWLFPDKYTQSDDVLNVNNVITLKSNEYVGVRVVYDGSYVGDHGLGKISVYVKEGGESNPNTEYKFLYSIDGLTNRDAVWVDRGNCVGAKLWDSSYNEPLYFGIMTKSGENSGTGNTGVTFKNVKVSYGLQSPEEIHSNNIKSDNQLTTPGDIIYSTTSAAVEGNKNTNVAGFAQTRSGQSAGTYDLRVAVEGGEEGLYRAQNYDAVIRVQMQKADSTDQKMIMSYSHHWAYREFSFYDAEYYFHANGSGDYGLICAVFNNIPEGYTDYRVYVDFYERGETNFSKDTLKVSIYLGMGTYNAANNTIHGAGGSPAPANNNGTENVDKKLDTGSLKYRYETLHKCFQTYYK